MCSTLRKGLRGFTTLPTPEASTIGVCATKIADLLSTLSRASNINTAKKFWLVATVANSEHVLLVDMFFVLSRLDERNIKLVSPDRFASICGQTLQDPRRRSGSCRVETSPECYAGEEKQMG